ncbi:hypothetical protein BACDOR_04617 [Phocaeicola dorei DSM 17855]|uniref:Uncharacterized protein n=1 Tax=Phocaeicola dorei DSM 17855 TaxID=483217 RepID=B6W501_9BACT|nr:hypothetical protein BACDOR_04617 [Phocaeicola dorei DSM 17855]
MLLIRCRFEVAKGAEKDLFLSLFIIPVIIVKNAVPLIFCLCKGNIFFVNGKNIRSASAVWGFFPYSAIFVMLFICPISGNFVNELKGYESSECKGVVLPQKERGGCRRDVSRNGKVECRQVF